MIVHATIMPILKLCVHAVQNLIETGLAICLHWYIILGVRMH